MRPYTFVFTLAVVKASVDLEVALSSNDECAGESCALNALQTRRTEMMEAETPEGETASTESTDVVGPFVTCDPLCHDGSYGSPTGDVDDTLGSSYQDTLGSSYQGRYIRHYAQNCWYGCGRHPGSCPGFCGAGNACCRWRAHHDPPECASVRRWPVIHWHTCVTPTQPVPPNGGTGGSTGNCDTRSSSGGVMTVYHQTGCDIGPLILKEGFHLGKVGWCGGGIYFALSPEATQTKAIGPDSHKGFMIEAQVRTGQVARGDDKCVMNGKHLDAGTVHGDGLFEGLYVAAPLCHLYGMDSVMFDPGDGTEVIVYCASQVLSTRAYPWKCS